MAYYDSRPSRSSSLKRSLYEAAEEDSSYDKHEPNRSKYYRTEAQADAWNRRQPSRGSLASVSTIRDTSYAGPTSYFNPKIRLTRNYRMSEPLSPEPSTPRHIDSYRPLIPAHLPSPCPSPSRMSMSSWVGELKISGSPKQIGFLSRSHVRDHLGTEYPTNNRIEDFRVGEILIVPWYAPNMDERNAIGSKNVAYASETGPICAKKRPVVVLFTHGSHLVTLPLASSGGNGTKYKSQWVRETNLPVKADGDEDPKWEKIEHVTAHGEFKSMPGTYVQCMQPFTVGLNWPIKRTHGSLDKDSVAQLCLKLTDELIAATEGLAKADASVVANIVRAMPSTQGPTSQPRANIVSNTDELKERIVRSIARDQRDRELMVPRVVRSRQALKLRQASLVSPLDRALGT